jgi:2-haloacid dehalogenase
VCRSAVDAARVATVEVLIAYRRCQRNHSLPHRNLLDEMINVDEVKIFKTSFRVYLLATERLKASNPELGFVSANNWDGCAAKSAGLRTFWIQRSAAEVPEELGLQIDTTVTAITELPTLLGG